MIQALEENFRAIGLLETKNIIFVFSQIFQTLKNVFIRLKAAAYGREVQFAGVFGDDPVHIVGQYFIFGMIVPVIGHTGNSGAFGQIRDGNGVVVFCLHQLKQSFHNTFFGKLAVCTRI